MSHRFFRYYTFVGHYLLLYGRTNNVVKDVLRSALPLARARKSSLHGSHRSTQTSVSVGADIRIGRRRHPYRSAQTSASVGADIRIGRRRCINRRVWHPCHTHAATPTPSAAISTQPHVRSRLRGYSRDAIPSYRLRGYGRDAIPSYR